MSAPIYEKLLAHSRSNDYLFAMPGHKGRGVADLNWRMDVTEVPGFDSLYVADGIIGEAQKKVAALCGADGAFFLVNGSSVGLLTAVLAVCGPGDELLMARNCHVSAYRGLVLSGGRPAYLAPVVKKGLAQGLTTAQVATALDAHPDAVGLVMVSPTFEGNVSDIAGIAALLHARGKVLIVDEAHGAHLGFSTYFPPSAMSQGADIVIQSWHKNLPSPTQTAVLLYRNGLTDHNRLLSALRLVQTTSPSYLFMAAMDKCREFLEENREVLFTKYAANLQRVRELFGTLEFPKLFTTDDPGKLVFAAGPDLERFLRSRGLYLEAAWPSHCVGMTSVMDEWSDLERLYHEVEAYAKRPGNIPPKEGSGWEEKLPEAVLTPREAFFAQGERVALEDLPGRVVLDFVIPYPPGIPCLVPGERATTDQTGELKSFLEAGNMVLGAENGVRVLR